jgi:hypothetical protein
VFGNKVFWKMFEPKNDEVGEQLWLLHKVPCWNFMMYMGQWFTKPFKLYHMDLNSHLLGLIARF